MAEKQLLSINKGWNLTLWPGQKEREKILLKITYGSDFSSGNILSPKFEISKKLYCTFLSKQKNNICCIYFSLLLYVNNTNEDDNWIVTLRMNKIIFRVKEKGQEVSAKMHRSLISNQNTDFQLRNTPPALPSSPPEDQWVERRDADTCASAGLEWHVWGQEMPLFPLSPEHLGKSYSILRMWYLLLNCSGYGKGRRSSFINAI